MRLRLYNQQPYAIVAIFMAVLIVGRAVDTLAQGTPPAQTVSSQAAEIVQKAIKHWRDESSNSRSTMTIHRPEWQREMAIESWTEGLSKSLVLFTAPARDAGSASLKVNTEMWSYSPKVRRVVKIPASMMSQSWMGSDFSYNDLARDDEIVKFYSHRFLPNEAIDGMTVYVIEATPKEDAPVVWGKEIVRVREDYVILGHLFYDQQGKLVKELKTLEVGPLGGRPFPILMRMTISEKEDHWTEVHHQDVKFGVSIPPETFSVGYLQNPR